MAADPRTPDPAAVRAIRAALALRTLDAAAWLRARGGRAAVLGGIFERAALETAAAIDAEERAERPAPPDNVVSLRRR